MSTIEADPSRSQRHLAAILACDVVRSSWHMERKEEETIRRLRDLRENLIQPKVAEHRGRIFKTMGDGFLAEFGGALDAVHCAVDIQRLMAERNLDLGDDDRLHLRIGINLGDVFREGDDVFGDGVNVAARLENSARPGGIHVSRAVCDLIRDRFSFDFDDLGEHQFHNITRPIHVFGVRLDGEDVPPPMPAKRRRWPVGMIGVVVGVAVLVAFAAVIYVLKYPPNEKVVVAPIPPAPPALAPTSAPPVTTPQPPSQPPADPEFVFWQSIRESSNPADFEAYLRTYPSGQFASPARIRIAQLRPPPAPQPPVDAEVVFWQSISGSTNAANFEEYLNKYPQGRFAEISINKIDELCKPYEQKSSR